LVVRAERGVDHELAQRMVETLPQAQLVEITAASHDVHLEQPEKWQQTVARFLAETVAR
jgi:pimeloyl-ACP methyl ester carboxylesterase